MLIPCEFCGKIETECKGHSEEAQISSAAKQSIAPGNRRQRIQNEERGKTMPSKKTSKRATKTARLAVPKLRSADWLEELSEGNPGALTVCLNIFKNGEAIDPDSAMGGFGPMLSLDSLGIYGSKIWMLFKDVCGSDLPQMLAVLRGWQLGFVSDVQIRHAVENYGDGISIPDICAKVVKRLPRFQLKPLEPA